MAVPVQRNPRNDRIAMMTTTTPMITKMLGIRKLQIQDIQVR
jgi:hypothetical protein